MNEIEKVYNIFQFKNAFLCNITQLSDNHETFKAGGTNLGWNQDYNFTPSSDAFFCKTYSDGINEFEIQTKYNPQPFFKSGFLIPEQLFDIDLKNATIQNTNSNNPIEFLSVTNRNSYIKKIKQIKEHIQRGDVYELNFCIQLVADQTKIDPIDIFLKSNRISQAPFSCLMKQDHNFLICSSPERFIRKSNRKLTAQPIKGTIRRSNHIEEDEKLKNILFLDPKERSENVMIVDLVRNDLSKVASKGTVNVDELFGIYSFPTVHQMISTISCEIKEGKNFQDVLHAAFPMGSMTGAPKLRAMQLIEKYEDFNRGLYSGSVGMFNKNGDFDLNVVIRSLFYDAKNQYLSICVGSAITINSEPEYEYNECLLKAEALLKAVNGVIK